MAKTLEAIHEAGVLRLLEPTNLAEGERVRLALLDKEQASMTKSDSLTPEEKATAFLEWAESHRRDTPVIPLEALRREYLYEDR